MFKRIFLVALALLTCSTTSLAETISFDGTVTASSTHEVYAASSAVVESVPVHVGDSVAVGDRIASLRTTKVYAEESGTVSAVFGQVGSSTETLTENYGAAIYMESDVIYTVSASTNDAYDSVECKLVHVGENVFLRSRSEESRIGTGIITSVSGTDYTIHVLSGEFLIGENVNVYRTETYAHDQRIGRGSVERNTPIAVTGSGRIASIAVSVGDTVKQGDLLMETLEGSGSSATINVEVSGIVAELNAFQGAALEENAVAAVIWPNNAMQIEATIPESDLMYIHPGDAVSLVFDWNADDGETIPGTVTSISALSAAEDQDTVFTAYISFTPTDSVRYGMNVTVNVQE